MEVREIGVIDCFGKGGRVSSPQNFKVQGYNPVITINIKGGGKGLVY